MKGRGGSAVARQAACRFRVTGSPELSSRNKFTMRHLSQREDGQSQSTRPCFRKKNKLSRKDPR